jgi:hypothetical protein
MTKIFSSVRVKKMRLFRRHSAPPGHNDVFASQMKALCVFFRCPLTDELKDAISRHRFDVCACELAKYKKEEEDTTLIDAIATGNTKDIQIALQNRMQVFKRADSAPSNTCQRVQSTIAC